MIILMGTVTSVLGSVIEKTFKDGMFQLTPSASSTDVLKLGNVYQICLPILIRVLLRQDT
jgi:branched-chain amino acid transport system substrate-binding protein